MISAILSPKEIYFQVHNAASQGSSILANAFHFASRKRAPGRTIKVFLKKMVLGRSTREYLCHSAAGEFSKIGDEKCDETKMNF